MRENNIFGLHWGSPILGKYQVHPKPQIPNLEYSSPESLNPKPSGALAQGKPSCG